MEKQSNSPEPDHREKFKHFTRVVKNAHKRCRKKCSLQEQELDQAQDWKKHQQIGDTLTANLNQIKKGASEVRLQNVHTQTEEVISLNPAWTVQKNIKSYYSMAKKGKRSVTVIAGLIEKTKQETENLENLQESLNVLREDLDDETKQDAVGERLAELETVLIEGGYLPRQREKKKDPEDKFRKFVLDDKWTVLAGKNNTQNDELTLHVAKLHDLWFHAYGSPGSHVVLRRDSKTADVPKPIIEKTAAIAAFLSKQKHAAKVPVNYTEKRYVRKPRKAPPGLVVIEREKTVYVKPYRPE